MAASPTILDQVQAGLETSRGTGVAATRKVYATARQMTYDRTLAARSSATGTFQGRRTPSYSRAMGGLSMTDVLTFENLAWWAQLCLQAETGTGDSHATAEAFTWEFDPDLASDTLKAATFEGVDKNTPYQWAQAMVNQFNLRWDSDSTSDPDWLIEATLLTLAPAQQAVTGSLTDRSEESIAARGTKVYIDDGTGTIGTSQITGKAISGSITGNNNLVFPAYAEDESGPPAGSVIRGEAVTDAQLVLSFQDDTYFAEFREDTPVQKLIRLEREGTQINDTPTLKTAQFDLFGYWSAVAFGERNGERTITLSLMDFYDTSEATSFHVSNINALDVLP